MEQRFFKAIWLRRATATGETLLGISNQVIRARTIRRMPKPDKYDKQMFDVISRTGTTMAPPPASQPQLQPPMVLHPPRRSTITTETQTSKEEMTITPSPAGGPQLTFTKSNSRHSYGIVSTSIGQLTDGHSTNKLSQKTNNAFTSKETVWQMT